MRMMIVLPVLFSLFSIQMAIAQATASPVSYTTAGAVYSQNFDGLPFSGSFSPSGKGPFNLDGSLFNGSGLTGWQFMMVSGTNTNATFAVGTGSGTGNAVYSLGASGSTERALGSLASSSGVYAFGVLITNNSGGILNSFTLGFTAEQWRKGGSANKNTWAFRYKTGTFSGMDQTGLVSEPGLDFSSVITTSSGSSLNGNQSDNQQIISYTVNNIIWKPGEQLLLRWDDADETGSDDVCAIDNISFSASLLSSAPTLSDISVNSIGANSAVLNATVNDQFARTAFIFEYDTVNSWINPHFIHAVPDTLAAGSGSTLVTASLAGLLPGTTYYWRANASNQNGISVSSSQNFTTAINLPTVITSAVFSVTTHSALLGGKVTSSGGATVTEKGIVWSLNPNPIISDQKIIMGSDTGSFIQQENNLPPGKKIYAKAYAVNAGGTAYGNEISFSTLNTIISFRTGLPVKTNAGEVVFQLQSAETLNGINASDFRIRSGNISNAFISGISSTGNTCSIIVNTGTGEGLLGLSIVSDSGLSSAIENIPFTATGVYTIDKTAPVIKKIQVPDRPMKIGDTIEMSVFVIPDSETYSMSSGTMNGFTLTGFTKINDSSYHAYCIIPDTGNDLTAAADIPVSVSLTDSAGNMSIYQNDITQASDLIDIHYPFIISIRNPRDKIYKSGDTLDFVFRFNEPIRVTSNGTMASLSLTIGSRSRPAYYFTGSGTDTLVFRYIVQNGESDKDGLRTASSMLVNNSQITDLAGNRALLGFSNSNINKGIFIDAVAPTVSSVSVPAKAVYRTGDILDFIVTFSKKVWINGNETGLSIQINIGTKTRTANYVNGNGSNAFLFRYTVLPDDTDKDGIKLAPSLNLTNVSIKDDVGNNAAPALNNIGGMSGIRINPLTAAISRMILPANGMYKTGDTLTFQVVYTERIFALTTNGIPYLRFTAGKSSKQAFYKNGSGSTTLFFNYIILPGDEDTDGIKLNTTLTLNNGSITDTLNNPVPGTLPVSDITNGIRIDGISPIANSISFTPGMYKAGEQIDIDLGFSEKVRVKSGKDTPFIQLTVGSVIKSIPYSSGSGSGHLHFLYIVENNDLDKNGIKAGALLINNETITDTAGNKSGATIKNAGVLHGVFADGITPVFINPQTDTIRICENSEAVSINTFFTVADAESSEMINWSVVSGSTKGNLSASTWPGKSNGKTVSPAVFNYTPSRDKNGIDSLIMQVTDSVYSIEKKLMVVIQPAIKNNLIGPMQIICTKQSPAILSGVDLSGGDGQYSYAWEIAADSLHFSKAPGSNTTASYSSPSLTATSWFRRKITSGACTNISAPLQISVVENGVWSGSSDNNWNNPGNWCNAKIPDNKTAVIIYHDAMHTIMVKDSVVCNQLTILNKTSLQVTGVLNITGSIINSSGSVNAENGTVIITGDTEQTLSGNSFAGHRVKKLIINNAGITHLQDSLVLTGTLIINKGVLLTHNQLYLSDRSSIGTSAAGTFIRGKVFIEHSIDGGRRNFRLLGHPFSNDIGLQMLKDSMDITGDGGDVNGFTGTITNQPSAFRHNPFAGNDSLGIDAGWIPFTNTNGANENAWKKNTGIRILMRGRPGQGLDGTPAGNGKNGTYLPQPVTLKLAGEVNTGDQEMIARKDQYAGYNVIANPYPSPIDLSRISYGSNIGMHYWIWDPQQGKKGGYSSMPFKSKFILPGFGAFILRANNNTNNSILFTENCKSADPPNGFLPVTDIDDAFYVELRLETDSIFWDRILLMAVDSARTSYDKNDAEKFDNPDVNFYSLSKEQRKLSTDARPLSNESVIRLGLHTAEPGLFSIRVAKVNLPVADKLKLHDKYLDKWMTLEKDSSYLFTTTTDTLTQGDSRFEIIAPGKGKDSMLYANHISSSVTPVPARDKIQVSFKAAETGNTSIRLLTLSGTPVKNISLGKQKEAQITIPVGDLLKGIYLLEIKCGDQISTKKLIRN